MGEQEKVSCVMITLNRFELFTSSYLCYCNQTYPNKELIIVTDGKLEYQRRIFDFIERDGRGDVRLITLPNRLKLGDLRNISVDVADGPFVCQWDDDDLYHPQRLQEQLKQMHQVSAEVSFLTEQLQLFWYNRSLYWCDWSRKSPFGQATSVIPGTILANKRVLPRYNPDLQSSEDLVLLNKIIAAGTPIAKLSGKGYLYIYSYHGENTFAHAHHASIAKWASLTKYQLESRADILESALAQYPLQPPISVVDAQGHNVFAWDGQRVSNPIKFQPLAF